MSSMNVTCCCNVRRMVMENGCFYLIEIKYFILREHSNLNAGLAWGNEKLK